MVLIVVYQTTVAQRVYKPAVTCTLNIMIRYNQFGFKLINNELQN